MLLPTQKVQAAINEVVLDLYKYLEFTLMMKFFTSEFWHFFRQN